MNWTGNMKTLEQLAKELFVRFSVQETGVEAKWEYLNKQRQLAWMKDVILIADSVLSQLQNEVKPIRAMPGTTTSFSMGYNSGVMAERTQFITILEKYRNELNTELLDFTEDMKGVQA